MKIFLGMNEKMLGAVLRKYRKINSLTQQRVADYLGIDRTTYSKYEGTRKPEIDVIMKLAVLYNVSMDDMLSEFFEQPEKISKPPMPSPLVPLNSPALSSIKDEKMLPLSDDEKRLLLFYRGSIRRPAIMEEARRIWMQDAAVSEIFEDE